MNPVDVILPLLDRSDTPTRKRAIQALSLAGPAGLTKVVEQAISDPVVRELAIDELTQIDHLSAEEKESLGGVFQRMLHSQAYCVSAYAILGRLLTRGNISIPTELSIAAHLKRSFQLITFYREALRARVSSVLSHALLGSLLFIVIGDAIILTCSHIPLFGSAAFKLLLMTIFFNVPLSFLLVVFGTAFQVPIGLYPSRLTGCIVETFTAIMLGVGQGFIVGAITAPWLIANCPSEVIFQDYVKGMSIGAAVGAAIGLALRLGGIAGYGPLRRGLIGQFLGVTSALSLPILLVYLVLHVAVDQSSIERFTQTSALWILLTVGSIAAGQASAMVDLDHRRRLEEPRRTVPWVGISLAFVAGLVLILNAQQISRGLEKMYPQFGKPPKCSESAAAGNAAKNN